MSILTGPDANIYADTTIPGTSAVAMTEFQAGGNSLILILTTTTGGCGSLTFTAEAKYKIAGTDTAYADVIDRDSVWSMVCTTPNVAGVYAIPMEGLDLIPNVYYRLSYTAATAAGKLKVDMLNWENPKGGGADISTGDIIADMDAVNTATAKSATTVYAEDTAHTAADPGNQILVVRNDTLASLCGTDGDYTPLQVDADGALYVVDETAEALLTTIDADTGAIKTATELIDDSIYADDGAWTNDTSKHALVGGIYQSTPQTVTDGKVAPIEIDVNGKIIESNSATIAGDTTSLDAKQPALGTAAMAAAIPFTLATDDTQFGTVGDPADPDGHIHGQLRSIAEGVVAVPTAPTRTVTNATGAVAINTTTAISAAFDLKSVTIHLSAALAAGETVYITLDANDDPGAGEYDAVLREYDLGTAGGTSFTYTPAVPIPCESGDEIVVTMANSLTRTYGLRIVTDAR